MNIRDRREERADNVEKRWTDREVLALLRAATAPNFVLDRVHAMIGERNRQRRRMADETTGQRIRHALNERIVELSDRIREGIGPVAVDAERADELTELRITVNRILAEAGEL